MMENQVPEYRMEIAAVERASTWDSLIEHLPGAHALQTWEWAEVKAQVGWQAFPLLWRDNEKVIRAAALVLLRSIRLGGFAMRMGVMYEF